jgi:hypothetical protein
MLRPNSKSFSPPRHGGMEKKEGILFSSSHWLGVSEAQYLESQHQRLENQQ